MWSVVVGVVARCRREVCYVPSVESECQCLCGVVRGNGTVVTVVVVGL